MPVAIPSAGQSSTTSRPRSILRTHKAYQANQTLRNQARQYAALRARYHKLAQELTRARQQARAAELTGAQATEALAQQQSLFDAWQAENALAEANMMNQAIASQDGAMGDMLQADYLEDQAILAMAQGGQPLNLHPSDAGLTVEGFFGVDVGCFGADGGGDKLRAMKRRFERLTGQRDKLHDKVDALLRPPRGLLSIPELKKLDGWRSDAMKLDREIIKLGIQIKEAKQATTRKLRQKGTPKPRKDLAAAPNTQQALQARTQAVNKAATLSDATGRAQDLQTQLASATKAQASSAKVIKSMPAPLRQTAEGKRALKDDQKLRQQIAELRTKLTAAQGQVRTLTGEADHLAMMAASAQQQAVVSEPEVAMRVLPATDDPDSAALYDELQAALAASESMNAQIEAPQGYAEIDELLLDNDSGVLEEGLVEETWSGYGAEDKVSNKEKLGAAKEITTSALGAAKDIFSTIFSSKAKAKAGAATPPPVVIQQAPPPPPAAESGKGLYIAAGVLAALGAGLWWMNREGGQSNTSFSGYGTFSPDGEIEELIFDG